MDESRRQEIEEEVKRLADKLAINHDPPDYAPVPDRGSQLEALENEIRKYGGLP